MPLQRAFVFKIWLLGGSLHSLLYCLFPFSIRLSKENENRITRIRTIRITRILSNQVRPVNLWSNFYSSNIECIIKENHPCFPYSVRREAVFFSLPRDIKSHSFRLTYLYKPTTSTKDAITRHYDHAAATLGSNLLLTRLRPQYE